MKLECERMNYRERRQFFIQCVITAACYHHREVWIHTGTHNYPPFYKFNSQKKHFSFFPFLQDSGRTQYTDLPSAPLSPRVPRPREGFVLGL